MAGYRCAGALAPLLLLVSVSGVSAQTIPVGDPVEDYLRILQILGDADLGSFTVRPMPSLEASDSLAQGEHPWRGRTSVSTEADLGPVRVVRADPLLRAFANSRFPTTHNDGAVWQGRGLTTALDFGLTAKWRWLTVSAQPTLLFAQNRSFELAPVSGPDPYVYPWRAIDLPQRFGPGAVWSLDPGQSEVRVDTHGVSVGASTKNMWWGPGIRNAIVMSDNAPGFPHAFIGTSHPIGIGIGDVEAQWIWGRLQQSDWVDPSLPSERFVTGIVAAYSPSFLSGLSLGFTRVFYGWVPAGGNTLGDYFAVFQGLRKRTLATPQNPTGDDEFDQLASVFWRWVLPESGFEVYGEWARNDHSWELRDFLLEPEHSQGYTLGLQKALELQADRVLALNVEFTHLEKSTTDQVRAVPTYYAHDIVKQGYTQKGQVIGAGIGPGGDSQFLGADLYARWGKAGLFVERIVHDNDAYYHWARPNNGQTYCCHDVSFDIGMRGLLFVNDFDLGAGMILTREYNRYFYGLDLWNLNLSLSARWRPR